MLHYEALEQLARDRTHQRRREAEAERLARNAHEDRQQRRPRALSAGMNLLLRARGLTAGLRA